MSNAHHDRPRGRRSPEKYKERMLRPLVRRREFLANDLKTAQGPSRHYKQAELISLEWAIARLEQEKPQ